MAVEHPIGKVIDLPDGRKVEVVEVFNGKCDGCVFKNKSCLYYACGKEYRTDHKNIIYKEIKEETYD